MHLSNLAEFRNNLKMNAKNRKLKNNQLINILLSILIHRYLMLINASLISILISQQILRVINKT